MLPPNSGAGARAGNRVPGRLLPLPHHVSAATMILPQTVARSRPGIRMRPQGWAVAEVLSKPFPDFRQRDRNSLQPFARLLRTHHRKHGAFRE